MTMRGLFLALTLLCGCVGASLNATSSYTLTMDPAWTLELPWSKHEEFLAAEDKEWVVDGKKAGRLRQVGPFSFQQVYEAGHMVPLDQPKNALALLKAFTLPEEQEESRGQVADKAKHEWMDMVKDESVMSIM
ncbi:hypothetical protein PRIC2_003290 [Phytophthora ramorum]